MGWAVVLKDVYFKYIKKNSIKENFRKKKKTTRNSSILITTVFISANPSSICPQANVFF